MDTHTIVSFLTAAFVLFCTIYSVLLFILVCNTLGSRPKILFHGYIAPNMLVKITAPRHHGNTNSKQNISSQLTEAPRSTYAHASHASKAEKNLGIKLLYLHLISVIHGIKMGFGGRKKSQFVARWKEFISLLQAVCMYK